MPAHDKRRLSGDPDERRLLARMLDARGGLWAAMLAIAALIASLAVIVRAVCFSPVPPFDADLLALLPTELSEKLPADLQAKFREGLAERQAERLVVLAEFAKPRRSGAPEEREAFDKAVSESAARYEEALAADGAAAPISSPESGSIASLRMPEAAGALLTPSDREALARWRKTPEGGQAAQASALACLMSASPKLLGYSADPFCFFDHWAAEQLSAMPIAEEIVGRRRLRVVKSVPGSDETTLRRTVLLEFRADPKIAASGDGQLAAALERAEEAAAGALPPDAALRTVAAGVPRFTDAIASRAKADLTMIGSISAAAAAALAAAFFGRLSVVILMAGTVAAGFAASLALSLALFGRLSLVTFVFGATLIGVALDYSTHWFAMKRPGESAWARRRRLLPPLLMACLSSSAAYGVLALTPLPGLKQMGAVAAFGVLATLFFVLALLPFFERFAPRRETKLLLWLERTLPQWPRLDRAALGRPAVLGALLAALLFTALGWHKLVWAPGVEDLNAAPASVAAAQAELSRALSLPSPAQAFFVSAPSLEGALQKEAELLDALAALRRADPTMAELRAAGLSKWLPPLSEQKAARADYEAALREASPRIKALLGAAPAGPAGGWVTLASLEKTPLKDAAQAFILEQSSKRTALLVMLSGLTPEMIPSLEAAADKIPGVLFVDITQGMRDTLSIYRNRVLEFLALGLVLLSALLALRFRAKTWRAVAPSAAGILFSFALLGWLGIPATLFTALAAVLLLGLGIDYGIFLTGAPQDGRTGAAVLFCGLTTMLAFGLLVFSSTPALAAFGLVVLSGVVVIWLVAPLLRPRPDR